GKNRYHRANCTLLACSTSWIVGNPFIRAPLIAVLPYPKYAKCLRCLDDDHERNVWIEDTPLMQIQKENVLRCETKRERNCLGGITVRDLLKSIPTYAHYC